MAARPARAGLSPVGPHPTAGGVVGTYVHAYDPSHQRPSPIPAMRPARDPSGGPSQTPIYDALYSEYRRSFRALPGDRSGEEGLAMPAFGAGLFATRAPLGVHSAASGPGGGAGGPGASTGRAGGLGSWQRVGRHAGRGRQIGRAHV